MSKNEQKVQVFSHADSGQLFVTILAPKCHQNGDKHRSKILFSVTFSKNSDLEQTPVFTMESHILAPQFHQLFMKIPLNFSAVFHLVF